MNERELVMRMLHGKPVPIQGIGYLYPFTLNDIDEMGMENYYQTIFTLCAEYKELKSLGYDEKITTFNFLVDRCSSREEDKNLILSMLSLIFREPVSFSVKGSYFYLGEILDNRYIFSKQYEVIKSIIKRVNALKEDDDNEFNPSNDHAKEIADKIKKARAKINKVKEKQGDSLDLNDLISVYCGWSNSINILNVWDMTIYQFDDQFRRMQLIDDYDIGIQSLLHGAKPSQVHLKHFVCKLDK